MTRLTLIFLALLSPLAGAAEAGSVFGSAERTAGSMIGIFYDLKQNQRRQPVKADFLKTLGEFLDSGWDESVLGKFFRGTKPLYATDVFIPTTGANGAPEAFELGKIVQPLNWFVMYKAQVSPPENGTWRFVGVADDVMAVGVNGKTVLVSNYMGVTIPTRWKQQNPQDNTKVWAGDLRRGDWFDCRKDQIIDLDILIGEYPGNLFAGWLLVEKKGAVYPVVNTEHGKQVALPVFQVKPRTISPKRNDPPFTTDGKPWVCHQ